MDEVLVFQKLCKQSCIAIRLLLEDCGRNGLAIRIERVLKLKTDIDIGTGVVPRSRKHVDVEFGNENLESGRCEIPKCGVHLFNGGIAKLPMPLDPESVDRNTLCQKLTDVRQNAGAFRRVHPAVVIVDQHGRWIHFAGSAECDLDEIAANDP
ncbi:MAG: hypothetical protein BWY82_01719 [Verrucomicrobia bacterium ADurb.Bin474]|nr:MAG: hypothetical protein BWY82_01719 [Verrucomicrobia bacterium ADurb.Bin474]